MPGAKSDISDMSLLCFSTMTMLPYLPSSDFHLHICHLFIPWYCVGHYVPILCLQDFSSFCDGSTLFLALCVAQSQILFSYSKLIMFSPSSGHFSKSREIWWIPSGHFRLWQAPRSSIIFAKGSTLIIRGLKSCKQPIVKPSPIFHVALLHGWSYFDGKSLIWWRCEVCLRTTKR